tara:strand:+ start:330 stop:641 length:312 start_codon:yes stop_codon:yes gene_type:complete
MSWKSILKAWADKDGYSGYYDQGQMDLFHERLHENEFQPVVKAMDLLTMENWKELYKGDTFEKSKTYQWLKKYLIYMDDNDFGDLDTKHLLKWLDDRYVEELV